MNLIGRARRDARRIVSDSNGFAVEITFSKGAQSVKVYGTFKKHHISFNDQGMLVNSLNASVTINEKDLISAGYPIRNNNDEVYLRGHSVTFTDAKQSQTYKIQEWYPDEHLGLLVCILGN